MRKEMIELAVKNALEIYRLTNKWEVIKDELEELGWLITEYLKFDLVKLEKFATVICYILREYDPGFEVYVKKEAEEINKTLDKKGVKAI